MKIEEYEGRWLVPLLSQAQENLGQRGHISTIVIDRGYLDGEDLWQVHSQGIIFVVVGKANMVVTRGAPKPLPSENGRRSGSAWCAMATAKRPARSACAPNWWASKD